MALKPAPIKQSKREIESIINKGGKVAEDSNTKKLAITTLRIPQSLLQRIDEQLRDRPGMSRNVWILEAINEKLKEDEKENVF